MTDKDFELQIEAESKRLKTETQQDMSKSKDIDLLIKEAYKQIGKDINELEQHFEEVYEKYLSERLSGLYNERSLKVTFDFTKRELEENLSPCVDSDSLKRLEKIQTLIREGWELTSIHKQIDKENDPNRGMISIQLTRF